MTMSGRASVREARSGDVNELVALCAELGYPSSPAEVERRLPALLSNANHLLLVGTDEEDRAVAWLHAVVRRQLELDPFVQVAGLVVGAGHRGAGLGARLLDRAEAWALQQGIGSVYVRSNVTRERAHRFYLRAGYTLAKTSHLFVKTLPQASGPVR